MSRPFSDFSGQFFWNFKRMDNVNYNFEVLESLYQAKKVNPTDKHFNKPIIIIIMAIIECTIYDFLIRINQHSSDPLPNITQAVILYLRKTKETDELKYIIPKIKSQNLLQMPTGDTLYDDLEKLRLTRNRIHIQNRYVLLPKDEVNVFTESEVVCAQICMEKVYDTLCNVYPRWRNSPIPMSDFPRPWL